MLAFDSLEPRVHIPILKPKIDQIRAVQLVIVAPKSPKNPQL